MNGYELSKQWFDFRFENPSIVRAIHSELYLFIVDKWNRLGQRTEIGMPTQFTMDALGIGSYKTYSSALSDLIAWGFIKELKASNNQYQSRIIALAESAKATSKALSKATAKAASEATAKPLSKPTTTIIELRKEGTEELKNKGTIEQRKHSFAESLKEFSQQYERSMLLDFYHYWSEESTNGKKMRFEMQKTWNLAGRLRTWSGNNQKFSKPSGNSGQPSKMQSLQIEYQKALINIANGE
jgi:hypothetical protein